VDSRACDTRMHTRCSGRKKQHMSHSHSSVMVASITCFSLLLMSSSHPSPPPLGRSTRIIPLLLGLLLILLLLLLFLLLLLLLLYLLLLLFLYTWFADAGRAEAAPN